MTGAPTPLLAALRRHWLLILVTGLIFGLAGTAWALTRPVRYTSTTTVLVQPLIGNPFTGQTGKGADSAMQIERAQLLSTSSLSDAVQKAGAGITVADLKQGVDVQVVSNTTMLQITYTAADPRSSKAGAQAVADSFLARRKATGAAAQTAKLAALKKEQDDIAKTIATQTKALAEAQKKKDSDTARPLNAQLSTSLDHATKLLGDISAVREAPVDPGSVIEPAPAGTGLSRLFDAAVVGGSAAIGLLLGLGLALLRRIRDNRVHGPEDVVNELVLAYVPAGDTSLSEPVSAIGVGTVAEEAYRKLRIAVAASVQRPAVVTVTSVGATTAASAAGANLAVSISHTGASVVLVDAAPESSLSGATALLRGRSGPGLAEALLGRAGVGGLLQRSEWGPQLLTSGNDVVSLATQLPGDPEVLLSQLRMGFDFVVVVAPGPTTPGCEALAAASDATVLVVTTDVTERRALAEARLALETVRANVIGAVVLDRFRAEPAPVTDPASRARHNAAQRVEGGRR